LHPEIQEGNKLYQIGAERDVLCCVPIATADLKAISALYANRQELLQLSTAIAHRPAILLAV
jgi:hypothetical protein